MHNPAATLPRRLAIPGLLVLLGAAGAAELAWPDVVSAARREGTVVVYSAAVGSAVTPAIVERFQARHGISVQLVEARASEIRERIRAEQASGRALGDVSHNGSTTTTLQLREGRFQPYGELPLARRFREPFATDGIALPTFVVTYGILVRKTADRREEKLQSWRDLLAPEWKGKLLADDFRALGGGGVFFAVMHNAFGESFHRALARQRPHFSSQTRLNEQRVARGEYPIFVPFTLAGQAQLAALPVKAIVPREGAPYLRYDTAILKNAPHPNAARVFLAFLLSDEVQELYDRAGFASVLEGVRGSDRPDVKLLGTTNPDAQEQLLALAREIYR